MRLDDDRKLIRKFIEEHESALNLTDKQKSMAMLYYFSDKTQKEIANDLGITPQAVREKLSAVANKFYKLTEPQKEYVILTKEEYERFIEMENNMKFNMKKK